MKFRDVLLFALIVIFDQITKYLADVTLEMGRPIPVIDGYFNLTLVYNTGAAFGMFQGLPDTMRRIVLWGVSGLALILVFKFLLKEAKDDFWNRYSLVLIISGAVGNIIDRFRFDYVVDFLDFYVGTYHWPAFNVADSAISIGITAILLRSFFVGFAPEKAVESDAKQQS
jgi:signal peptidase II